MYRPKRITDRAKPDDWFLISGNSINDLYSIFHQLNSTLRGEDQYNIQKMISEAILPEILEKGELSPYWTTDEQGNIKEQARRTNGTSLYRTPSDLPSTQQHIKRKRSNDRPCSTCDDMGARHSGSLCSECEA
tara:strand:+ start:148 stop:546 length:399 start_codon:yes stop_codon:yes gene_type:complete